MCGIVAYVGKNKALSNILEGLKKLEYRGYDSAGITVQAKYRKDDWNFTWKSVGNTDELRKKLASSKTNSSTCGIGHTRWATHGVPSEENAHPHFSADGKIAIVHNGMIENYRSLKTLLEQKGYSFKSETDTEVLAILIGDIFKNIPDIELSEAVRLALKEITGAYAIAVISRDVPNMIVVAKKSSPLVIGLTHDRSEYIIASSQEPLAGSYDKMINLEDDQLAIICPDEKVIIKNMEAEEVTPYIEEITMTLEQIEKGGFDHFMLKEIHEQPESLTNTMRGRLNPKLGSITLGGLNQHMDKFIQARKIVLLACGTSFHSALVGKYLFEQFARISVSVENASEFRYRNPVLDKGDIVLGISQSGETADTNGALILAKSVLGEVFGICNVVGSELSRLTTAGCYTHAGVEIGVASTKAFTAQVALLTMMALRVGRAKGCISETEYRKNISELGEVPKLISELLKKSNDVKKIAELYSGSNNFLYMGRGYGFPIALEGALKLKEISYIHAEGLCAAEIKHGIIALVDDNMPTIIVATKESETYGKVLNGMNQIKARNGKIIAICSEGDIEASRLADHVITIPAVSDFLIPIIASIPLQLLAYYVAVKLDREVDQPRGLAKAVTVE